MINKKNIWFLTLFSLILVLSVYYITMPSELLLTNLTDKEIEKTMNEDIKVEESSVIAALKLEQEENRLEQLDALKMILTDTKSSVEEKNNAFDKMKNLDIDKADEEKLENKLLEQFKLESFVKIDGNNIKVVIQSDKKDTKLANDIMRFIQNEYDKKMYITVEFK